MSGRILFPISYARYLKACGLWCVLVIGLFVTLGWAQSADVEYAAVLEKKIEDLETNARPIIHDPIILTKLAGLYLQLGDLDQKSQDVQIAIFEKGAYFAEQALTYREDLADAHFYYAANLGRATQLKGVMASALIVKELRSHAERAVTLKADHASALHMLGRMLDELPWILGGDDEMALQYLLKAVSADEYDAHARLDLAKFYLARQNVLSATRELQTILRQPAEKQSWSWRQRYKPEAERILRELNHQ